MTCKGNHPAQGFVTAPRCAECPPRTWGLGPSNRHLSVPSSRTDFDFIICFVLLFLVLPGEFCRHPCAGPRLRCGAERRSDRVRCLIIVFHYKGSLLAFCSHMHCLYHPELCGAGRGAEWAAVICDRCVTGVWAVTPGRGAHRALFRRTPGGSWFVFSQLRNSFRFDMENTNVPQIPWLILT